MFTVQLKTLFFKKNISETESLLTDQAATYVILRYAHDIPSATFDIAMNFLVENIDDISDVRLLRFVNDYIDASGISFEFTDEFDHTLEIVIGETNEPFAECGVSYDDEED